MELIEFKKMRYYDVIELEYINLCDRAGDELHSSPFYIPFFGDICKEVFESATLETADNLIKEAMCRGDYEIYGMEPEIFLREAQSGNIEGFRDTIPIRDIQGAIYLYLSHNTVSHLDYFHDVVNPPVRSVW